PSSIACRILTKSRTAGLLAISLLGSEGTGTPPKRPPNIELVPNTATTTASSTGRGQIKKLPTTDLIDTFTDRADCNNCLAETFITLISNSRNEIKTMKADLPALVPRPLPDRSTS